MANKKIEKRYNDDNFVNPDKKDNPLFDLGVRFMMSKEYSEAWNKVHLFCKHEMQFRRWYNLNSIVHEDKYPKWRGKLVEIIKDIIQRQGDVNHGFSLEFSEDYKKIRKFEWDNELINKLNNNE